MSRKQIRIRFTNEFLQAVLSRMFSVPDDVRVIDLMRVSEEGQYHLILESGTFQELPEGSTVVDTPIGDFYRPEARKWLEMSHRGRQVETILSRKT